MKFQDEGRLIGLGCLTLFAGMIGFVCLAFSSHWAYSIAAAGMIGVGGLIVVVDRKRAHRGHVEMLNRAFAPSGLPVPQLEHRFMYGFPHFTLTFASQAELRQAEALGCVAAFKQAVQARYGHTGSKQNPFNADSAVWATYVGRRPSSPSS